jgi:peptidoglycan lytic transglycosylase G
MRVRRVALGLACALVACGSPHGRPVRVIVPPRSSLGVAADSLARAGIISSPRLFRLYAKIRGGDRGIKAGTYLLQHGTSWGELLDALRGGKGLIISITIPEGFATTQIVPLLSSRLNSPLDSVWAAVGDTALLHRLGVPTPTLEGYLFPDTYNFPPGTSGREAIVTMVRRFEQAWKPGWTARLDTIAMTRNDVLALASIVEKEAKLPEERPVIAAVYMNRLKNGMLLQADPTVQYAIGVHQNRVLYKHLEVESPYNTYKHKGLPPGPIASPGIPSILAALYPASVPYKYFVALPDGHHEFRVDFAQHERAVHEARKAWDSLAPKETTVSARRPAAKPAPQSATAPSKKPLKQHR